MCCQDKGASASLSALPLEQHRFAIYKNEFTDAPCLCYGWTPPHLPSHYVCGKPFSVTHAFSCLHGAYPIIHHHDICDFTAKLFSEVCYHDVQIEPHLQPLTGEILHYKSAVHKDVMPELTLELGLLPSLFFFDVCAFNVFAESNQDVGATF